jgi:DNA invertase Pin-like site-specific DNA recombinase
MSSVNNKAIGYVRTAITTQTEQDKSLERQKEQILEAAKRSNIEIVEWFEQEGYEPMNFPYKALDKALEYCQDDSDIKYLIVSAPSRLARQLEEFQYWKIAFERIGVTIAATDLKASEPLYRFSDSVVMVPSQKQGNSRLMKVKEA